MEISQTLCKTNIKSVPKKLKKQRRDHVTALNADGWKKRENIPTLVYNVVDFCVVRLATPDVMSVHTITFGQ